MNRRRICMLAVACVALLGIYLSTSGVVSVSNTVNGKELPIYCVETDEKKVALSFDAAWGDSSSGYKNEENMRRKAIATVDKKYKEL